MASAWRPVIGALVVVGVAGVAAVVVRGDGASAPSPPGKISLSTASRDTLAPFENEAALKAAFDAFRKRAEARSRERSMVLYESADAAAAADAPADAAAAPASPEAEKSESITNVQTAGVDEGGIVKRQGDHLVVLRRGRLFTVKIGDDSLRPVSTIDAFGPGIDPGGAWYDEMLVSDDTIVVIGYSYQRGGTELNLFDLSQDGRIAYRATYHLRSNDYYSSRNYASRLIGDKLIFYSPLFLSFGGDDIDAMLPALRPWRKDLPQDARFTRIIPAERIYRAPRELDVDSGIALHTVTVCDLARPALECTATAVLGAPGQTFYVSGDAAYVWTNPWSWREDDKPRMSDVFRIPLDGGAPTAMQASGAPIDQLSFLERDGHLNVLVGAQANGQWMWASESSPGTLALLRVPLSLFGDGRRTAGREHYRVLDERGAGRDADDDASGYGYGAVNRFVGDWLLLGTPMSWDAKAAPRPAYGIRYAASAGFQRIPLAHGVERIEAMGTDAILVGGRDGDLHFTSIRLGASAGIAGNFVQKQAAQGESRSHGFFYRPVDRDNGYVGLPTVGLQGSGRETASVIFLRNTALALSSAGALDARGVMRADDGCKASCVDWYGNARPIFIGDRVFALMGYELVEGRYADGGIVERRRVDFTPVTTAIIAD
jgi:hypothetical protein